ncbi:MAG: hypothetical protein ACK4P1_08985 [Aggregatilineales bacterium]
MPNAFEPHVSERIFIQRYIAPVNPDEDMPAAVQAIRKFYEQVGQEFFVISDARQFPLTFDTLVEGLDLIRRNLAGVPMRFVIIGDGELIRLVAEAITQKQYGGFEAGKIFPNDEEALAYCMAQLQKSA